jgi:hypothetical protein
MFRHPSQWVFIRCKHDNMSDTCLLLGLLLVEYFLEYSFLNSKYFSKTFIIFLIFLSQGLCKRFQNICNCQKF